MRLLCLPEQDVDGLSVGIVFSYWVERSFL